MLDQDENDETKHRHYDTLKEQIKTSSSSANHYLNSTFSFPFYSFFTVSFSRGVGVIEG